MRFLLTPLLLALAVLAGCGGKSSAQGPSVDFALQSAGGPVDTRTLRGQVLLVYFGYTHCPDVCPAAMAAGAQALNGLTPEERARTRLIMVSVDPERDTPERLRDYTAFFHPQMVGVTGTAAQIEAVARAFGAGYLRQPADSEGRYAVDHSANTYLVAPDGHLAATLPLGAPPADVMAAIRRQLS